MPGKSDWAVDLVLFPLYGPTPLDMDGPGSHFYAEGYPHRPSAATPTTERRRSTSFPSSPRDGLATADFRKNVPPEALLRSRSQRHHHSHTRQRSRVTPDVIDQLDNVSDMYYHHEGPYDAVYPERNICRDSSPLEAVKDSNEEALRATPLHKIIDSVTHHRPLDGVAFYPPGMTDPEGQTYNYAESSNVMSVTEGNFQRTPGMKFTEEDFKKDPFYQQPGHPPRRSSSLRKALGYIKRRGRKNTA